MKRQLIWTFVAELTVMAATVGAFRLAAQTLGPVGFGEYVLTRRVIGLLQLPLALGLGIAAPRYVAIADARGDRGAASDVAITSVALALGAAATVLLLGSTMPGPVAALLLGSPELKHLVRPLLVALFGFMAHALLYALLRGRLHMRAANAFQIVNAGLLPPAVLAFAPPRADVIIATLGALWCVTASAGLVWVLGWVLPLRVVDPRRLNACARELLAFGLPRVPGEFALVALFALPPVLLAHTAGVVQAGHLSFALSVLTMVGSAFAPVGLVLLPRASAQAASGKLSRLRYDTRRLLTLGLGLAAVGVVLLELFASVIVTTFLGPDYAAVTPVLRWVLLGAVPYVAYIMLRNVLDAVSTRPLNSSNVVLALGLVAALALVRHDAVGLAMHLALGLTVLGVLTWRHASRLLRAAPPDASVTPLSPPLSGADL